ncbi:MAG: adenylate/guanylate cyclase domain-containing protein [Bacteroidota bacterium]
MIALATTYLKKREDIAGKTRKVEAAYIMLLKSVKTQQDFFSYETKNDSFFKTGNSKYLDTYTFFLDSTVHLLTGIGFEEESKELASSIRLLKREIEVVDTLFTHLTDKVKERGFKDYNLIGRMRDDAHWLERIKEIPTESILSLRRHEKDYMIRNQLSYVEKLKSLALEIGDEIKGQRIPTSRKDSILSYLNGYTGKFTQLVAMDQLIGINDDTGLKQSLDQKITTLEKGFSATVNRAKAWMDRRFQILTLLFGFTTLGALLASIILSYFIAKRITNPLTELTLHITKFVDSNFTLETDHPVIRSKDEIGKLTQNFSILKDEVISRLKFFKEKVDERTAELAEANHQLKQISDANSRFVPKEFLHYLGREGIEHVQLGDQVEKEMTIVFTDIRDFTKISEGLSPQETFDFINRYLKGIVPIIRGNGGFIDKYIGDTVMALFPEDPETAIQAVFDFRKFLDAFNHSLLDKGKTPVEIGTGIHTGHLILGTIGHDKRLETTVISDAVNTAARVEGLTKYYGANVIASQDTLNQLPKETSLGYRFLDEVRVKGRSKSLAVYEFLQKGDAKLHYLNTYNEGVRLMKKEQIKDAFQLFSSLNSHHPSDGAVKVFLARCKKYLEDESVGWASIEQMMTK